MARIEILHKKLTKKRIDIFQINLGDRCNQVCSHCHMGASPHGERNMDSGTARRVLDKLLTLDAEWIEFTGGSPELNPNLTMFIEGLAAHRKKIAVRTNLTVLDNPEYSHFIDLYGKYGVKITASLPSVFEDRTDEQRGKGAFAASIRILKKLNDLGYGTDGLSLDLVYNPDGGYLPPDQGRIEREYRQFLRDFYGISFSNLVTIANVPIGRFKNHLSANGELEDYKKLLIDNFNIETLEKVMCRGLVSIDYQGFVYDCDFNLALGKKIKGCEGKKFWEIDFETFNPEITFDDHCYACTAERGSSCHGALIGNEGPRDLKEDVKLYYGETLTGSSDLKTTACCTPDSIPEHIREVLSAVADEIKEKYYGCGSPIPLAVEGLKALDIGCGTGRDSYTLSRLVGEKGFVYGIDMTEKQIGVAERYLEEQTRRFGYREPNVKFIHDYIENVGNYFKEESLDLVVSNCVVNLVEDKEAVLREIYRMLKRGGEFYFSDIYSDRRTPEDLRKDPTLYAECLGGALYQKDFERLSKKVGFIDPRIVSKRVVAITNREIKELVGNVTFYSITYRLWKLEGLDEGCEDYGHIAVYRGGLRHAPFSFELDGSHVFEKDRPEKVCGNTALMLSATRFRQYFQVLGSFDVHFGEFNACAAGEKDDLAGAAGDGGCC